MPWNRIVIETDPLLKYYVVRLVRDPRQLARIFLIFRMKLPYLGKVFSPYDKVAKGTFPPVFALSCEHKAKLLRHTQDTRSHLLHTSSCSKQI